MAEHVSGIVVPQPSQGHSPPKLLDRVREAIRAKHYSRRTESAYVDWIRRYILFHKKRHPSEMGASDISAFLTWLAVQRRVSASTQNQALSAVLFLYRDVLHVTVGSIEHVPRARTPIRVPVVLSRDEVARIMKQLDGSMWIIAALLYGAGLRLQECLGLRVKDIDLDRHQIIVRRGKGQKDRSTVLPSAVAARLSNHLERAKRQHADDLRQGCGRAVLPFALDRKYPNASTEWAWQFVFPASRICRDPRWGPPSRFHLHESVVQRAVAAAASRSGITKRVGPHTFRHAFAVHLLEAGTDVRTIQLLLSAIGVSRPRLSICASRATRSAQRPARWISSHDRSRLHLPSPRPPERPTWVAQRRPWRTCSVAMARSIGRPRARRSRPPSDA